MVFKHSYTDTLMHPCTSDLYMIRYGTDAS